MSRALFALLLALAGLALAQQTEALPPPVPRQPAPSEPGLGERAGEAVNRAARATARTARRAADETRPALERAGRWTGRRLEDAGEWTTRQGRRLSGEESR